MLMKKVQIVLLLSILFLLSCESVITSEEAAQTYFNLGNAYNELGKAALAEKAYQRALELDPELNAAGYNLARVLLANKKYDQAIIILENLLGEDTENQIVLETLAWAYHSSGNNDTAYLYYRDLLEINALHINGLYNAGVIAFESGQTDEALKLWNSASKAAPEDSRIQEVLFTYYLDQNDNDKALPYLESYTEGPGADIIALRRLAEVYRTKELYSDTLTVLDRLIAIEEVEDKGVLYFEKAEILLTVVEDYLHGIEALTLALENGFTNRLRLLDLVLDDDLLYRDEIEAVLMEKKLVSPAMIEAEREKRSTDDSL